MSHHPEQVLHAYANRAEDIRIDITTEGEPGNFTSPVFRVGNIIEKTTGITFTEGGDGVLADLTLSAALLDVTPNWYRWELAATVAGQPRTISQGWFHIGAQPTGEEDEP